MHTARQRENLGIKESPPVSLRKKQEELRLIADALPVLIAHVDGEERYRFNSRAYECWFGHPPEALYGRTIREVLGQDTYQQLSPRIRAAFAGEKQFFEGRLWHRRLGERVMQIYYVPRTDRAGKVEGLYILMTDVTDHRRAENEIQRLNAELEQRVRERTSQLEMINKELEAFCYSVSHDLRAPLRTIRGFSEVLLEQYVEALDGRAQDLLRRACLASAQMDDLIDDLLELSRVSRSELHVATVDLSALAKQIVLELKQSEPDRAVEFAIAPGLQARGDGRLLRLVLDNLLRNAWKFTGKRAKARIELGRSNEDESPFYVRDNGSGFDMAYAHKLFRVFQRLHSASEFPGSGVGLAIVQRIVNRHSGRVWAVGETDAGATFYFTLPAAGDGDSSHAPQASSNPVLP